MHQRRVPGKGSNLKVCAPFRYGRLNLILIARTKAEASVITWITEYLDQWLIEGLSSAQYRMHKR